MLLGLAALFVVVWIICFFVFHTLGFLVHILLVLAVISIVFHFLRGSKATT